jgi:excisionase family DNA binding protein
MPALRGACVDRAKTVRFECLKGFPRSARRVRTVRIACEPPKHTLSARFLAHSQAQLLSVRTFIPTQVPAIRRQAAGRPSQASPPHQPDRRRGGVRGTGAVSGSPATATSKAVEPPILLDSRQVAHLLGISRTKAFQLIAQGDLPVIRIGRCVRVPRGLLEAWILAGTSSPGNPDLAGGRP